MRKTKKSIAILALVAMVLTMIPMAAFGATDSTRLYGTDRVGTAIAVANAGWTTSTVAILAPADQANLVDALAAAPLAGQENAPILLTEKNALNAATAAELAALKVSKVFVVGAIQTAVADQVRAVAGVTDVVVLQGADRVATAAAIAGKLTSVKGSFVVGYSALVDALSTASYAAANGYSILLADLDGKLPASEASFVGAKIYTVGGPTLVADIAGATRLSGADRYATNDAVLKALSYQYANVYVANGEEDHLVDSLVASSLAAKSGAAIVLGNTAAAPAAAGVSAKMTATSKVVALGGPTVVPQAVANLLTSVVPGKLAVSSVSAINSKRIQVVFNSPVDEDSVIDSVDGTLIDGLFTVNRLPVSTTVEKNIVADDALASLSDDGKTLTITAAGATYLDGTYTVYVDEGIVSEDGSQDLGTYSNTVTIDDQTNPTVTKVAYNAGTNNIEVTMSEPVEVAPTITVNNGAPAGVTPNATRTKFLVANGYPKGTTVNITVAGATDFMGNSQSSTYTTSLNIQQVTASITVTSLTQVASNKAEVVFSAPIAGANAAAAAAVVNSALTVLRNGVAQTVSTVARDADDSTNCTFDVTFSGGSAPDWDIYTSGSNSTTLNFTFGAEVLSDVYGNTNDQISKSLTMVKDTTAPALVTTKLSIDSKSIVLRFGSALTDVNLGQITVRDSGVDVTSDFLAAIINPANDHELLLTYAGGADVANGNYSVRVPADTISDSSLNNNDDFTTTLNITDNSGSTGLASVLANGAVENSWVATFDQKVGNSVLTPSNWTLNGVALPSTTDIYFQDSTKLTVVITLGSSSVNYSSATAVLRNVSVLDDNGIKVTAASKTITVVDNVKPTLLSATLNGNILTLNFDENVDASAASNITTLAGLAADVVIKGGSLPLVAGDGTVSTSVDGKKVLFVIGAGTTSNWNTVKATSSITVKTLNNASSYLQDATAQNVAKDGVQVVVTKI